MEQRAQGLSLRLLSSLRLLPVRSLRVRCQMRAHLLALCLRFPLRQADLFELFLSLCVTLAW